MITKLRENYSNELKVDVVDIFGKDSTLLLNKEVLIKLHDDLKMVNKEELKGRLNNLLNYINKEGE